LLVAWFVSTACGEPPTIDGVFSEWSPSLVVASDAKGDATKSFDITEVSAATNGTELYLHFDIGTKLNLQNGEEEDGTLGVAIDLPSGQQIQIDFRGRTAKLGDTLVPWSKIAFYLLANVRS
jgi:hypothetical protein